MFPIFPDASELRRRFPGMDELAALDLKTEAGRVRTREILGSWSDASLATLNRALS